MGDTACLVHAFSYTSGLSNEPKQGNPLHALGESVSFGRFMSESLAWEKWSTFSQNRYVEEAERYAQPGSVAQKKAFFEAHYKRIAAAKKAAALLEQATAANNAPENPADGASTDSQVIITFDSYTAAVQQPQVKMERNNPEELGQESNFQSFEPEGIKVVEIAVKDDRQNSIQNLLSQKTTPDREPIGTPPQLYVGLPSVNVSPKKEASNSAKIFDNQEDTSASERSRTPQMEKPLLKNFSPNGDAPSVKSKKKSAFSSLRSSIRSTTSTVPSSPAKMVAPSIRIEQNPTPLTKKPTLKFNEKKEGQQRINYPPATTPERLFAPSNAKTPNSKVGSAAYKAFQACISPLRTPNPAASARMSKNVSATPQSENTRIKSTRDGSKTEAPKWNILSAVCSKPLTARRNKLQSPTVSTPFTLRTEERAARRKQKLEEKFNSKEALKVQLQTKIKERAEFELRKLRQTFCFKARPLPDFYKERETAENQMNSYQDTISAV